MNQICRRESKITSHPLLIFFKMTSNEDLERRIEILEKEVQHLKAALQYQTKNKKKSIDSLFNLN